MRSDCSWKKGRNIEEWIDEGLITTDLAFLVDVTGHSNNLNKGPQGKDNKLSAGMYDNIKAFKVRF
jgi:hypothetical protein